MSARARPLRVRQPVAVWGAPVRILHWIHFASIAVLGVTGYYIGHPYITASSAGDHFIMGNIRYAHFVAAFVFMTGFLARFYWAFRGNRFERLGSWLPITRRGLREFWDMLKYYLFLRRDRPNYIGVNPMAGLTYSILGVLIIVVSLTGLALFSLPFSSGIWPTAFGWLNTWLGSPEVRLIHHLMLWFFIAFFAVHLYLAILDDLEEHTGELVSMINGEKCEPLRQEEKCQEK